MFGLNILFRRKGLGAAYNATMPSPEEVFTKEPNHTHIRTHTLSRIGCLIIIPNVTITRSTQRAQTSLAEADHYSHIAHCKNVEPWL